MNAADPHSALQAALRALPAVDHVLKQPAIVELLDDYPRGEVLSVVRSVIESRRSTLRAGHYIATDIPALALEIRERLYERSQPRIRRVINATGIVLHTNLGRAPLPAAAVDALVNAASGYCNLEYDLATGRRGSRHDHLRDLLRELCQVEDALVVNNNAAATYLALHTFGSGRAAIISRGQLVEIGGSYRLPDIMAAANCRMVEVGTTNRTRISDYERAIDAESGLLLRVHCSNYRIEGFTASASLAKLVELGRRHNLLVVDDLGSGLLTPDLPWPALSEDDREAGVTTPPDWDEPSIAESIATGADLTLFSGDKLLGGPQAGIILGRRDLIADLRRNPLTRAFRPGKLTLAALEATLRIYRDPGAVIEQIPAWRYLARSRTTLERAARDLADAIAAALPEATVTGVADFSEAGGGSLAARPFPTWVVAVAVPGVPAAELVVHLRQRDVPIICRIRADALLLDPRTVEPDELEQIPAALAEALRECGVARD